MKRYSGNEHALRRNKRRSADLRFQDQWKFPPGKKPELGYMTMDGQEVFKFAVKKVPQCITEVLEDTGVKAEDVRYFAIHQANYRIIESIAKRLKVNVEPFPGE